MVGRLLLTRLSRPKNRLFITQRRSSGSTVDVQLKERETVDTDVLVVGGGPAGLAAAIRLRQLALEKDHDIQVMLIEKGAEIGKAGLLLHVMCRIPYTVRSGARAYSAK